MFGLPPAYLVAIAAMLISALSALTLITIARHLDPPEAPATRAQLPLNERVAV